MRYKGAIQCDSAGRGYVRSNLSNEIDLTAEEAARLGLVCLNFAKEELGMSLSDFLKQPLNKV